MVSSSSWDTRGSHNLLAQNPNPSTEFFPLRHRFLPHRSRRVKQQIVLFSVKSEEEPPSSPSSHDLFDLARKERVRLLPSSKYSSHGSLFSDRGPQPWKQWKEEEEERFGKKYLKPISGSSHPKPGSSSSSISRSSSSVFNKIYSDVVGNGLINLESSSSTVPLLPSKGVLAALFGFVFIFGIAIGQRIGRSSMIEVPFSNAIDLGRKSGSSEAKAPTGISVFLEGDLKKKESVEWVNMVLGKLWKIYRLGLESWLVNLLQPLIDNLKKPDYVKRVEIKRFDLGDEPLSIRSVERRTSRRADDLQYHIGLRYTGGAHMLLLLKLKGGFIPVTIPVGVREFDVDGEIWVKLRLVPSEPWVGTATWAFVSLPKIKLDLSPFRLFNLMATPFVSVFLTQLLTEDLPQLFVQPNKNVIDFLKGRVVGSVPNDFKGATMDRNTNFSGELSVTLVHARKLKYDPYGNTDPYVILTLGDQVIRSKKNSQTTVIGPPGGPIWNQDFQLLVVDRKTQRLDVRVRDYFGITAVTVGAGEVDLMSLKDTIPVDKVVRLRGVWGPFRRRIVGEVLLRLTYTAYVEDEADDPLMSDGELTSTQDDIPTILVESDKEYDNGVTSQNKSLESGNDAPSGDRPEDTHSTKVFLPPQNKVSFIELVHKVTKHWSTPTAILLFIGLGTGMLVMVVIRFLHGNI